MKIYTQVLLSFVIGVITGSLITALTIPHDVQPRQLGESIAIGNPEKSMSLGSRDDFAEVKQKHSIPGGRVGSPNVGASPVRENQGSSASAHMNVVAPPSPQEETHFQAFSQRVNQQLVSKTLTLPEIIGDPEMQTLPQSLQKKLLLDIAKRINNKELDIRAVLPAEN